MTPSTNSPTDSEYVKIIARKILERLEKAVDESLRAAAKEQPVPMRELETLFGHKFSVSDVLFKLSELLFTLEKNPDEVLQSHPAPLAITSTDITLIEDYLRRNAPQPAV